MTNATPKSLGYYFPAEFAPHDAIWLSWPHKEEVAVIDIDTEKSDSYRTHWPFLRDRRIDSYAPITKRYLDEEAE